MSELKAFESERIYWSVEQVEREAGDIDSLHLDDNLFYIKSEVDKVIAHYKYKRCLAMADFCDSQYDYYNTLGNGFWLVRGDAEKREEYRKKASDFWWNWHLRWLELAEKFKEEK